MRKKSLFVLILAASCFVSGCGCGQEKKTKTQEDGSRYIAAAGSWKDGSYTHTAVGHNGGFDVTVNIENGSIKNIMCGQHSETEGTGEEAVIQVPAKILQAQSTNVDGVSGATVTSDAIKKAVNECLADASEN